MSKTKRLALGCMGMSGMYGASDDAEGEATIRAALDRGVTFLDTGDFYGQGHNELLIGRAIRGRRGSSAACAAPTAAGAASTPGRPR